MAYTLTASVVMAYVVMAYVVMAYVVMAYVVVACIAMAYVVKAGYMDATRSKRKNTLETPGSPAQVEL